MSAIAARIGRRHNDPMPDDFSFQLFPDDLERLERYLDDAVARVPILGTAGLSKVINGPIPYAPDGNPLIGPMPGVPNAFEACVFTFGIAQAGGAGKVLAEWVTRGPDRMGHVVLRPAPLHRLCLGAGLLRRQGHGDLRQRIRDPVSRAMPGRPAATASCRRSTIASRRSARSSTPIMAGSAPPGTRKPGDDISEEATQTFRRDGPWQQRIREECLAVRDAAGILDLPGFSRFRLQGRGRARMAVDA